MTQFVRSVRSEKDESKVKKQQILRNGYSNVIGAEMNLKVGNTNIYNFFCAVKLSYPKRVR